jgi:hypothetical protein
MSALGRPERESPSAQREGQPVLALGRPECEPPGAQRAGLPIGTVVERTHPLRPRSPAPAGAPGHALPAQRMARNASLLRALTAALLAGVQRTTELNWQAARLLLAAGPTADWRANADRAVQSWRMSWRAYQVCAVTASEVLDLVRAQAQAEGDDLWRVLQQLAPGGGDHGAPTAGLQSSLQQVQASFGAYLQAVLALQRELAALALGDE